MYESFWGFKEKPFENTPNPRFFFASRQHQEAFARMLYCIRERKGAGLLTGAFGCGKTVVGYTLFQELNRERYRVAFITNPRLSAVDLLRMIVYRWGRIDPPSSKADVLIALEHQIQDNAKEGRDTVIVVDEAHALEDPGLFEELRLLLNFQTSDGFLVTLLLFGQPELAIRVEENKPLEQRIGIKSMLGPLDFREAEDYIRHRLRVAGHPNPETVFTVEAVRLIHESTGGIPRRINRLCDICLLAGTEKQLLAVDGSIVMEEVKGLTV